MDHPTNNHVKSQSKDSIIFDIYQLDPTFYKRIISRSSSFRFTHSNSFKSYTGKVPFVWETQPGTPRAHISAGTDAVKPIRFPPAIYSLTVPKPCIPPTGAKAYLLKSLQKVKKVKNLQIQIPKIELHMPKKPNSAINSVKVYLLKNLKKVEKIKSSMRKKGKTPREAAEADEKMSKSDSDGFESSYSDFEDFTPAYDFSGNSGSGPSFSFKSPKMTRFGKGMLKWSFAKRRNGNI